MVTRVEDLAPAVGRSTRKVARPLTERDTRAIAREELKQVRAGLIDEARRVARQEAAASVDEAAAPYGLSMSWSMVLMALLASAVVALSTTTTGLAGAAVVATVMVALSILYAVRS